MTLRGEWQPINQVSAFGVLMLVLSGIATSTSHGFAITGRFQLGPASKVAPIDKLSVALVVLFSVLFLGETLTWKVALGGFLICSGRRVSCPLAPAACHIRFELLHMSIKNAQCCDEFR